MSATTPTVTAAPEAARREPLWYKAAAGALVLAGFPEPLVRTGLPGRVLPRLFAAGIAGTVIALIQYTPWAPLPDRMDSTVAGIAAGLVGGPLMIAALHRIRRALRIG